MEELDDFGFGNSDLGTYRFENSDVGFWIFAILDVGFWMRDREILIVQNEDFTFLILNPVLI